MRLELVPPPQPQEVFGNAWKIYAEGEIDREAGQRLELVVSKNNIPRQSIVYLNSIGGSLTGGMELGRAIRAFGLFTHIGKSGEERSIGEWSYRETKAGECYSSATLAFLGGTFRWIDDGSAYGVHRFYSEKAMGDDIAQILSARVMEYVREMGVDPALFSEMIKEGRDGINVLSGDRLRELGIINGLTNRSAWTIESFGEGLYFKGERLTWRGINKFIVIATPKGTLLHVIFNPEGRGDEAIQMEAHSLFIDDKALPLAPIEKPHLINGLVNSMYNLDSELLAKIKEASTVGIAMQWTYEAPVYLGFNNMDLEGGREKLRGYLAMHGR